MNARGSTSSVRVAGRIQPGSAWDRTAEWNATPGEAKRAQAARSQNGLSQSWIDTIALYRFPLACAVVAVHSAMLVLERVQHAAPSASDGFGLWIVEFFNMACKLATPSFLVMAGFMFFRDGPLTLEDYRRKIRSRFFTLAVPYLAWNLIAVVARCGPSACKDLLMHAPPGNGCVLTLVTLGQWFVGWPVFPVDAPLWFVRDLLLLALAVPLLSFIPRWIQLLLIGALSAYWFAGPVSFIPGGIPRASSVFFFLVGAWIGMNRVVVKNCAATTVVGIVAASVFLCSCGIAANIALCGPEYAGLTAILDKIVRFTGATIVILFTARRSRSINAATRLLQRLSKASFFMFAAHYCVLLCITSVLKYLPHQVLRSENALVLFTLICLSTIVLCLACYSGLKRYAPSLLALLDGNRSGKPSRGLNPSGAPIRIYPELAKAVRDGVGSPAEAVAYVPRTPQVSSPR